jgi:hypothetical protein
MVDVSRDGAESVIRRRPQGLSPLVRSGHGLMLKRNLVIAIAYEASFSRS